MKLNSTYVEGLKPYINIKTNRIHSFFHQTITATGRISSTEPNLQNIPTRFELGKRVRKVFKPEKGKIYLDADYSQIEFKTSRPSVCNAEEVCLVHRAIAKDFLPRLKTALVDERKAAGLAPVELRLDEAAAEIIPGTSATERDFDTEFLDYILAVAVVDDLDAAIAHVQQHSTHHSDCIVTENKDAAARFVDEVDSAAVYVNVSTRFTDGGEFGLGCEMGISTQKLHARGPMGLDELSTYKYVITGSGQVR